MKNAIVTALVLGSCFGLLAASCGAQSKAEVQYAAIVSGCAVSLDIERDAGAAGAESDTAQGCRAALHAWESK